MANAQIANRTRFIPNGRGGHYLINMGFKFSIKTRKPMSVHWRCCKKDCCATINTKDGIVTTYTNQHNHQPDESKISADALVADLRETVRKTSRSINAMYQETLSDFRSTNTEVQVIGNIPMFANIKSTLYRSRAKDIPPLPRYRSEIDLPDLYTKTSSGEDFLIAADGDDDKMLVFSTLGNLHHLSQADTFFCDGTFDKSPEIFTQLYSIHAFVDGKMFPLVYGLLPNKKQTTYQRFFSHVKDFAAANNIIIAPTFVFTDFEVAAQNAVTTVFPGTTTKGCFFHYSQAIWRNVQKHGLTQQYADNPHVTKLVRRAIALPLVPLDKVSDMWLYALESSPDDPSTEGFKDYVTGYWVEGDHGRQMWNHYNTVGPRTTNHVEGWHRKLTTVTSECHPNQTISFLKKEQAYTEACIIQLNHGGRAPPRKKKYRQLDDALDTYKRRYASGQVSCEEYLDLVGHLTGY